MPNIDPTILLVKPDGSTNTTSLRSARNLADEFGLDLVEVSSNGSSRVYKIMDRGKWKYEQKKRKKFKKSGRVIKEVKFRLRIEKHDLDTKISKVKKFLEKDYDVLITVELRGRERKRPQSAVEMVGELTALLDGLIKCDNVKRSGIAASLLVRPLKKG